MSDAKNREELTEELIAQIGECQEEKGKYMYHPQLEQPDELKRYKERHQKLTEKLSAQLQELE